MKLLPPDELNALNDAMEHAFATGDESGLDVLGYGEMTTVVRWSVGDESFACKRLPPFNSQERIDNFHKCFDAYIKELDAVGIQVAPSLLQVLDRPDRSKVVYCLQPEFPAQTLAMKVVEQSDRQRTKALFQKILQSIRACDSPRLGIDGQLSNWVDTDQGLYYLDVTTPLLRDRNGADLLDADLFLAAAPVFVRGLLKRLILKGMLDKYHSRRGVVMDLIGNLYKERLVGWIPMALEMANAWVSPALTQKEVRNYYLWDARIWVLWQALRRADRFWRMKIRRRPYPFLLPGRIERHV